MTPDRHIKLIRDSLQEDGAISVRHLDAVEAALRQHPASARLWCLRGDLVQLLDDSEALGRYEPSDAERSYQRALELDPDCAEELGHFYGAVMGDAARAQPLSQRAARLRAAAEVRPADEGQRTKD